MSVNISVSQITFSDGNKIAIEKTGIVVLVGPNNSGKSVALRDIHQFLNVKNGQCTVVKDIEIEKEGGEDDLFKFLRSSSKAEYRSSHVRPFYKGYQFDMYEQNAEEYWRNYKNGLNQLTQVFVSFLDTQSRLSIVGPAMDIPFQREFAQHPIHFLQRDELLAQRISKYFKQAFGSDLIINWGAGSEVPLHIGDRPIFESGEDRVSPGYVEKIEKLPTLHTQGDGMKSFMGILLNTIIDHKSIFLIDEPESFLHPPQARLLGKIIAEDLPENRQLFLSTHNEDFLKGLLEGSKNNLQIIRIERSGNINRVCELNNEDIKKTWSDPLLRYSNILSGLFHKKVIICESDSDCRFYSAVFNSIHEKENKTIPDVLFVHCGGKHRIPVAVKALKKLNVPTSVIVDFDILNDKNPLGKIIKEIGGDWNLIEAKWKLVKKSIDSKKSEIEKQELREKINKIFDGISENILTDDKLKEINGLLKKASPWSYAKESGKLFIPSGNPTQAFDELNKKLNEMGVFIVEVGELEGFEKSIGNHGPKWVNEVLEKKDLATDPNLEAARKFIQKVIK